MDAGIDSPLSGCILAFTGQNEKGRRVAVASEYPTTLPRHDPRAASSLKIAPRGPWVNTHGGTMRMVLTLGSASGARIKMCRACVDEANWTNNRPKDGHGDGFTSLIHSWHKGTCSVCEHGVRRVLPFNVRCGKAHAGNTRLVAFRGGRFAECQGCGATYSADQVRKARAADPGSGSVILLRGRP